MGALRRLVLGAAMCLSAAAALAQQATEPAIKAAFLYKFAGYVEWPPEALRTPDAPLVIGVLGSDEVATELERIVAGRTINNRRVVARRMRDGESLAGVHILFVGRGDPSARTVLRAAQQQGVLSVTEAERGLEMGSAVNFVQHGDRIAFEVSLEAAERAGLRISSRMLAVARRVMPRPG